MATRAVNKKQMVCFNASKDHGVPQTTLRRVQGKSISITGSRRFLSTFSLVQDKELLTHMLELDGNFLGHTKASSITCICIDGKQSY